MKGSFLFVLGEHDALDMDEISRYQRQLEVASILRSRGSAVTILALGRKAERRVPSGPRGMAAVEMSRANPLRLTYRLVRILTEKQADAVVCKDGIMRSWSALFAVLASTRLAGAKVFFDVQDLPSGLLESYGRVPTSSAGRLLRGLRDGISYRLATGIVALNTTMKRFITSRGPSPDKVLAAPRGSDTRLFHRDEEVRMSTRHRLGFGDCVVVGWIGGMKPQKAVDSQLVPAFGLARKLVPFVCLLLVGEGSEKAKVMRALRELKLDPSTTMLGWRPYGEMPALFQACDVVAVPLHGDGEQVRSAVSTKVLDSLAVAVPVVAAQTPALIDEFGHDGCLIMVPRSDPAPMGQELARMATDPKLRRRLGKRGERVVRSRMDLQRHSARVAQFLERSLNDSS